MIRQTSGWLESAVDISEGKYHRCGLSIMLTTQVVTRDIPNIYNRFADVIGDRHWKKLASELRKEMKGNKFLEEYIHDEYSIVFQLENMRAMHEKYRKIPSEMADNEYIYPAISFAAQILSIMESSTATQAAQLKQRVYGAIKNSDDMRGLGLELNIATHFILRGDKVVWPETEGVGTFDLLIENLGPDGLEIECKSVSKDKGRKIHTRQALDFYNLLWPKLRHITKALQIGLSIVVTIPDRMPSAYKDRVALVKDISAQVIAGRSAALKDGSDVRITEFGLDRLGSLGSSKKLVELRSVLDDVSNTDNCEGIILRTQAGGALAITLRSAKNDSLMRYTFDLLSKSAKRQLSGGRAGVLIAGFHDVAGDELQSIAAHDSNAKKHPTSLKISVNDFLLSDKRPHVVGVGFVSRGGLRPEKDGVRSSGGIAYHFPVTESPYWNKSFSGLFGNV